MSNRYVVGLTGGISSGKSVVSGALGAHPDVTVVDADVISREIYDIPEVAQAVAAEFPESIEDGALNRRKLRAVFSHAQKTERVFSKHGIPFTGLKSLFWLKFAREPFPPQAIIALIIFSSFWFLVFAP